MKKLSKEAINEFKLIFFEVFGYALSEEEASEYSENLMKLVYIALKNKLKKL